MTARLCVVFPGYLLLRDCNEKEILRCEKKKGKIRDFGADICWKEVLAIESRKLNGCPPCGI